MFLILSTLTALLECGSIFLGMHLDYSPGAILSFCLAYQFGNLFPVPFHSNKRTTISMAFISTILLCTATFSDKIPLLQWVLYFIGIILLSCTMQNIRCVNKKTACIVKKRISRIIGFLFSPLMLYIPNILLFICCLIILLFTIHIPANVMEKKNSFMFSNIIFKNNSYKIMLWHQLHYFCYAYTMILVAYNITQSSVLTMLFFAFSWLTYLISEPILTRKIEPWNQHSNPSSISANIILCGHIILLFILTLIPNVSNLLLIILWILTGFGGGTVFAISALCKLDIDYKKEHLDLTENIGHFLGTVIAVIWTILFPNNILHLSYISAFCIIIVLIQTLKIKYKTMRRRSYEN